MLDQNSFIVTLKEVAEIIRTSATAMSREEILSYFKDMELTPDQEDMVFTYLSTPHEDPIEEPESEGPDKEGPETRQDTEKNPESDTEESDGQEDYGEAASAGKISLEELAAESPVFAMYLEEVKALPVRNAEETNALYEALSGGDETVVEPLLHSWLPQVLTVAGRFFGDKVNLLDVIQEGNMSLFLKLKELCGSHRNVMEIQLSLMPAIEAGIRAFISEMSGEEDCEETIAAKANMVEQAVKTLTDEKGQAPELSELASYTHMSEEELQDIQNIMEKARTAAKKKQA